jgi:hypothetical protein
MFSCEVALQNKNLLAIMSEVLLLLQGFQRDQSQPVVVRALG